MNSSTKCACVPLLVLAGITVLSISTATAQMLSFSNKLTMQQVNCLSQLLRTSDWKYLPQSYSEMMKIAQVATAVLNNTEWLDYIYIFEAIGWCGTAGCPLLIGELGRDGVCHLLYDAAGDTSFTVLRRRDHGYHRIYAPCEARFDGHQYQQLHEDCPNLDVPR
jgi:hypothetical protein